MSEPQLKYGTTNAESIRALLEIWPNLQSEFGEALEMLAKDIANDCRDPSVTYSWCHLYELPFNKHVTKLWDGFSDDETFSELFKMLETAQDKIAEIPIALKSASEYIDSWDSPTKKEKEELMPIITGMFVYSLSIYNSLKSLFYYSRFLNDLIAEARQGNDKALFNAIKIDPTIIGCPTAIRRISKAALVQDKGFFKSLKAAISGKFGSLEQANFQKMRFVVEVLHESKAINLTDDQLKYLFVDVLKLYVWNERDGGSAKSLRKYVNDYMRKNTTT